MFDEVKISHCRQYKEDKSVLALSFINDINKVTPV